MPEEKGRETLAQIFACVQANQKRLSKRRLLVTRSKNAVTFYRVADQQQQLANPPVQARRCIAACACICHHTKIHLRSAQVITNVVGSIGELLMQFDVPEAQEEPQAGTAQCS